MFYYYYLFINTSALSDLILSAQLIVTGFLVTPLELGLILGLDLGSCDEELVL